MATDNANTDAGNDATPRSESDALNIQDMLHGIVPEGADAGALGAYLTFETVGNSTIVSVDIDGPGSAAPIQLVTLPNVTGVTLQDLLNNLPDAA
jgi:predicted lipoprotein